MLTFLSLERPPPIPTSSWRGSPLQPITAPLHAPIAVTSPDPREKQDATTGQTEAEQSQSTLERIKQQTPNAITLLGYSLGLWWSIGGPTWAGIVSIVADELDGRLARSMNATSETGSNLDWAADVALVPMSLLRFGRSTNLGTLPLLAAPPILWNQSSTRADKWTPPVGSWRAGIMATTMLVELLGSAKRAKV